MSVEDLQIKRAQVRSEFDGLSWRYRRLGERLDRLAKEIQDLGIEITVTKLLREDPEITAKIRPLKMEID